jgi:hypothetical protein
MSTRLAFCFGKCMLRKLPLNFTAWSHSSLGSGKENKSVLLYKKPGLFQSKLWWGVRGLPTQRSVPPLRWFPKCWEMNACESAMVTSRVWNIADDGPPLYSVVPEANWRPPKKLSPLSLLPSLLLRYVRAAAWRNLQECWIFSFPIEDLGFWSLWMRMDLI